MRVNPKEFYVHHLRYTVRSAMEKDAKNLSEVRLQIDGETENMDRERGEAYIDESGFIQIIREDTESLHNLFLVAEVNGNIVGFSRCEGNKLKRTSHKVEFDWKISQEIRMLLIKRKIVYVTAYPLAVFLFSNHRLLSSAILPLFSGSEIRLFKKIEPCIDNL